MTHEELRENVKVAIRLTVEALKVEHSDESLAGYALLTDDALETLSYIAVTKEALAASPEPDLLFCPTDWPHEPEQHAFELADRALRTMGTGGSLRSHVDAAFATLVQALADCQDEGLFSPHVFLSVLSTDPSPYLEKLESSSVQRLNLPRVVVERESFLKKWE